MACAAFLAAVAAPLDALACSPALLFIGPPTDFMRSKCRNALNHKKTFLQKVRKGTVGRPDLLDYVVAFDQGKNGCQSNSTLTYEILKAYYSAPARRRSDPAFLRLFLVNFPADADPAERSEIVSLVWLFVDDKSYIPSGWSEDQARAFVELPEHWPIALNRFGKSLARDNMVFTSVTDPRSRYFDRQLALRLAEFPSSSRVDRKIHVAELYSDPAFGAVDLPLAERLLPTSVFYTDYSSPQIGRAREIWNRIAAAYASSADPTMQHKGARIRARLTPPSSSGALLSVSPPQDGRLWLSLADWPKALKNPFASGRLSATLLTENDYPTRALREEQTGAVTLAARFGPDGKFVALEVVDSSGSALLDNTAAQAIQRRLRPKLSEMTIEGYSGREVWVPILIVDWQIVDDVEDAPGHATNRYANGILTVVAKSVQIRNDLYNSCGVMLQPSIFI